MTRSAVEPRKTSDIRPFPRPMTTNSAFIRVAEALISLAAAAPVVTIASTCWLRRSDDRRARTSAASAFVASRSALRWFLTDRMSGTTCSRVIRASRASGSHFTRRSTRSETGVRSTGTSTERMPACSSTRASLNKRASVGMVLLVAGVPDGVDCRLRNLP